MFIEATFKDSKKLSKLKIVYGNAIYICTFLYIKSILHIFLDIL